MTRRRTTALSVVPDVVDQPNPDLAFVMDTYGVQQGRTENVEAFELGRKVGISETERDAAGLRFADGLRLGLSLAFRLQAGDVELARQIEVVLATQPADNRLGGRDPSPSRLVNGSASGPPPSPTRTAPTQARERAPRPRSARSSRPDRASGT